MITFDKMPAIVAGIAVTMLLLLVLGEDGNAIQCARRPGHVYVVDHQACLPVAAFVPAATDVRP